MSQNTNNGGRIRVERSCAFCGRSEEQVEFLIPSPTGIYICDKCIDACNDIITDYFEDEDPAEALADAELPTPMEIKATLDDYIIGQDNAKIALAVAVYNHRGIKLGYITRHQNTAVANIMDSGMVSECFGIIQSLDKRRTSVGMLASIYYVCEEKDYIKIIYIIQRS